MSRKPFEVSALHDKRKNDLDVLARALRGIRQISGPEQLPVESTA